jgi:hypothetical protein
MTALVIDFGSWLSFRRLYQNVTDAATLAGAAFLTRPTTEECGSTSKAFCARRETWHYLNDSLDLGLDEQTLDAYASANTGQGAPIEAVAANGGAPYALWVDTPPGAAGTDYVGRYPDDTRKVWARVDRLHDGFFSRVFCVISDDCITDRTVTGWATAGGFPNAWAVMTLRRPGQAPGDIQQDIKLAGTNSRLEVVAGDVGGNWNMKLNADAQLWIRGETDNEADTYLIEWQSCGQPCWTYGQANSGPNGNPAWVPNEPDPLPTWLEDPNYPLPEGVDPNGGPSPSIPRGLRSGRVNVVNADPGGTIKHGNDPLACDPASPRIGPGYYTSIDVAGDKCLILDPIYDWTDWGAPGGGPGKGKGKGKGGGGGSGQTASPVPQSQQPGIFYVDGPITVGQDAMIVGDGVTLVMRPAPSSDSQNQLFVLGGGVVALNLGETPAPPPPDQQLVADCLSTSCRLGGWTTLGVSPYLWSNSQHRWAYQSAMNDVLDNVGVAFYVIKREQYTNVAPDDSSRVIKVRAGAALVWTGVTYAPHDNVDLSGLPGHDGLGQLICWTLNFAGGTPVKQTYTGPESSIPRLYEPTIP